MGQKQKAFIADVQTKEQACAKVINDMATVIAALHPELAKLKTAKTPQERAAAEKARTTAYGKLVMGRNQLRTLMPQFKASLDALKTFTDQKSKRWFGKSTLPEAKKVVTDYTAQYKDYEQFIVDSTNI